MGTEKEQNLNINEDFLRILSHQLKSPINSMQSLLKTITQGFTGEVSPETQYFLEKAIHRAEEAKDLISDLLLLELYTNRQKTNQRTEVELVSLLRALSAGFIPVASAKNISLVHTLPLKKKVIVKGNARELEIVFRNLIENALKYTPEQGQVTVKLDLPVQEKCRIEVSDTGYGMAENELKEIFKPFYRSIKHKSGVSGTGLGLAIVEKLVSSHSGEIAVSSKEGKGSTFTVILPYAKLEETAGEEASKRRVVIIGGVTAGPKAAARLRRLDEELDITVVEKGEFLAYSGCGLPAYLSNLVRSPRALMSTADNTLRDVDFFESIKNIKVLTKTMALKLDREQKQVKVQNLTNRQVSFLPYDVLILATGGKTAFPTIPGIRQKGVYSLYKIEDAEQIKKKLAEGNAQDVFILGGGLVGIETAESLLVSGARLTILEKRSHILLNLVDMDIAVKIQAELNRLGIKIINNVDVQRLERIQQQLIIETNRGRYNADLVILSTGVKPNALLAKQAGLVIGDSGGVKVNKYLQTSDESIYAVGDCAESTNLITKKFEYWPLGSVSTKMGRIAADNICAGSTPEKKSEFNGFLSTAMFQLFGINVARTGLTEQDAHASHIPVETIIVAGLDKVHYIKDAQYVVLKIMVNKNDRTVLGAQGYGRGNIISKIQILSCAITNKMTLDDIFKLDLGHTPAFNQPIDILQTACLVLNNKLDGFLKTITFQAWEKERGNFHLIDVSPAPEHEFTNLPSSINIPLENLRLEEIPFGKNEKICLYSRTSSRAYEAYRYLVTKGFRNLHVLEGGFIFADQR